MLPTTWRPRLRMRTIAVASALAVAAAVPLAGTASAQPDRDCPDFPDRAAAQAALDSRAGDPERLDADHDGIACEDFPYSTFTGPTSWAAAPTSAPAQQVAQVPVGGVAAGDGTAADVASQPATVLAQSAGSAFVAGIALVAALALAGTAALATAGRMLLRRLRDSR